MKRIAYVSTYPPRRCGIATFTEHLLQSVRIAGKRRDVDPVIVLYNENDDDSVYRNDPKFWPLAAEDRAAYARMAERVNRSDVSVVVLQHEFGIFGGEAGEYILDFVRALKKPLVTTFHTIFADPQPPYRRIQQQIADESDAIVVMNRQAIPYLTRAFNLSESKIFYIPHGAPVPRREERNRLRRRLGFAGRKVMFTFGLLNRGKGIESVLAALPGVIREVPETLYVIAGQTHPEVKKREGEAYREELMEMVRRLGLENNVQMINRYFSEEELVDYLTACDLYVTPYPGMQQITSGTLAYAVGVGRPVLTTPYEHARDLLRGCEELLLPYGDTEAWERQLRRLLADEAALRQWEERIWKIGEATHWPRVGAQYVQLFAQICGERGGEETADAQLKGEVKSVVSGSR
ncbi:MULTISPECIES: glycosyltransferase family 4 protein [Parageobacillus]|jgi:polysaccharide biosynthesis protein PslF|uniref:Glycosyl transferase family 1 n=1 Tax=Parageobacillus thermoglucosidasius TaxID=1426 RepID=A0A1B7KMF0_PARTM|nr:MULTISPECIES: glycosyltransferase family 4 protein [Parageobacillus]OAT71261.1 glycosyl transferase family 1 [Parageobacillus thermoglucosidasius]BDG47363.1 glycosyl transferase family 1 [Parageobacillus sp. KH3-4]